MCLAVPGKVLAISHQNGKRMGRVDFGGVVRRTCLDLVPEAAPGDYVIVHVGFAISRVDAAEAARAYELLRALDTAGIEGEPL